MNRRRDAKAPRPDSWDCLWLPKVRCRNLESSCNMLFIQSFCQHVSTFECKGRFSDLRVSCRHWKSDWLREIQCLESQIEIQREFVQKTANDGLKEQCQEPRSRHVISSGVIAGLICLRVLFSSCKIDSICVEEFFMSVFTWFTCEVCCMFVSFCENFQMTHFGTCADWVC